MFRIKVLFFKLIKFFAKIKNLIFVYFYKIIYEPLNLYFWENGNTFLLRTFLAFLFSIGFQKNYPNYIWLSFISCLIANKEEKKALTLLHQYTKKFGTDFIHLYLYVADFAYKNGIITRKIQKASQIFNKLQENEKNNIFANLLKNKSIAFVGNSPQQVGKNTGKEIDAHDIVIRFNNYEIKNFENDYGSKTDIWVRGYGGEDLKDYTLNNNYLFAGITGNYFRIHIFWDFQFDILYRDLIERNIPTGYISPKLYSECRNKRLFKIEPTTGCSTIYTVLNLAQNCTFDFYGFSFLEDKKVENISTHYFNDRSMEEAREKTKPHNLNLENKFLRKLLNLN